jgi:branched-chain amino acid aminotransferase
MNNNFLPIAYFEENFIPFVDAKISIATHSFHYGTGAFGGMRGTIKNNQVILFRLQDHAKRLASSSKFFHFDIDSEFLSQKIIEFVQKNKPKENFYIRLLIYVSDLGIAPRIHNVKKDFLIYGLYMGDYLNPSGVSCRFSSWTRQEDRSVPLRGKIVGTYTLSAMAKTEAVESGFDEALILNSQGKVCEASAMNIFIVRNNTLITPSVDQDILEGITRNSVISIAKHLGIEVVERAVDKSEVLVADEVFLTGTAGKITPVNKIESYKIPTNSVITKKLITTFESILNSELPEFEHWITKIDL